MKNFDFNSIPIPKTFIRFKKIFQKGKLKCLKIQISGEDSSHTLEVMESEPSLVEKERNPIYFGGDIAIEEVEVFLIKGTFTFMPKHEN